MSKSKTEIDSIVRGYIKAEYNVFTAAQALLLITNSFADQGEAIDFLFDEKDKHDKANSRK